MAEREVSEFERIVRGRLDEMGSNPYAVEARSPLKEGVIRNVLRGTDVRLSTAKGICKALGLELYIGPPRPHPSETVVDPVAQNLTMIRRFDVYASAGHGADITSETEREPLAFRHDWLTGHGITPNKAVLIQARGHSMAPIISNGDLVMIDQDRTDIPVTRPEDRRPSASYWVVRVDDDLLVKDAFRPDDHTVILSSVDPQYVPVIVDLRRADTFQVLGRVAWWGHTVPL